MNQTASIDTHYRLVSAAGPRIYQDGAYLADDNALSLAEDETARLGITTLGVVFPTQSYRWYFTAAMVSTHGAYADELVAFYAGMSQRYGPASVMVSISDAVLFGPVVHAAPGHGYVTIFETYRPNDRPAVTLATHEQLQAADAAVLHDRERDYFLMGSAGSFNYGHWLIDDLPRTAGYRNLVAMRPERPVTIVIDTYGLRIDSVRLASLQTLLGPDITVIFLDPARAYLVPNLVYVTPVSDHPVMKSPVAMADLRARVLARIPPVEQKRRIFVTRGTAYGRAIRNLVDVTALVEAHGFTGVDPDSMDFEGQAATFAAASVVIGTMGAGMTNTLFCEPGTPLLYLTPHGWAEPFYWDLSVVGRHHYTALFGPRADTTVAAHLSDFDVPLDLLAAFLTALPAD